MNISEKCIFLSFCALYFSIGATTVNAAGIENDYGIRMDCADSSTIFHKIEINFGVQTEKASVSGPLAILSIPITRNGEQYLGCLELYGKNTDVTKMAYLQDRDRCRLEASSQTRVSLSAKRNPVLISGFDAERFEKCLHESDRKLEVELIEE